jgi:hypothetical protein
MLSTITQVGVIYTCSRVCLDEESASPSSELLLSWSDLCCEVAGFERNATNVHVAPCRLDYDVVISLFLGLYSGAPTPSILHRCMTLSKSCTFKTLLSQITNKKQYFVTNCLSCQQIGFASNSCR